MDVVARARTFVTDHHPGAVLALLGGSHARGTATATSDLDVVVVDPTVEWAYRRTWYLDGVKVETFVYRDLDVLAEWLDGQRAKRQPTLPSLVAESIVLIDVAGAAAATQAAARQMLAAGPGPLDDEARLMVRYHLTDLHDDLLDIAADELGGLAALAWELVATSVLHAHGAWLGRGKWLRRYVERVEPGRGAALDEALRTALAGDRAPMVAQVARALGALGGRVDETAPLVAPRPTG